MVLVSNMKKQFYRPIKLYLIRYFCNTFYILLVERLNQIYILIFKYKTCN